MLLVRSLVIRLLAISSFVGDTSLSQQKHPRPTSDCSSRPAQLSCKMCPRKHAAVPHDICAPNKEDVDRFVRDFFDSAVTDLVAHSGQFVGLICDHLY